VDSFDVDPPDFDYPPRFNIAPGQDAPIIAQDRDGRRMGLLRWGLVPAWADDPSVGNRMINARAETAAEKPAFRGAFKRRRCAIPADGFYEWKKSEAEGPGKSRKVPYWIHREAGSPFLMAGLWERWTPAKGTSLFTFTILTTAAAPQVAEFHSRMPVILPGSGVDRWLDPDSAGDTLRELLQPRGEGLLAHAVSTLVNSPRNDGPACIEPED